MVTVRESVSHGLVLDPDNATLLWRSTQQRKGCASPPPPYPLHVSFLRRVENKDAAGNSEEGGKEQPHPGKRVVENQQRNLTRTYFLGFCF